MSAVNPFANLLAKGGDFDRQNKTNSVTDSFQQISKFRPSWKPQFLPRACQNYSDRSFGSTNFIQVDDIKEKNIWFFSLFLINGVDLNFTKYFEKLLLPFQVKVNLEDLQNMFNDFIEMTKQNAAMEPSRYRITDRLA